jgi:hypothetical protein
MTTLRGGTYRTPPEIWRELPDDHTRRDVYMRRYLALWRKNHPGYSARKNREWSARNSHLK